MAESAVLLLSGGLDSVTAAAIARAEALRLYALSCDYGQRHRFELEAAGAWPRRWGSSGMSRCRSIWRQFGGSALTADIAVPKDRTGRSDGRRHSGHVCAGPQHGAVVAGPGVCRNGARRPTFLSASTRSTTAAIPTAAASIWPAFERLANLATKAGVEGTLAVSHPRAAGPHDQGRDHSPRHRAGRRLRPDAQLLRSRCGRPAVRPLRCLPAAAPRDLPRRGWLDPVPYADGSRADENCRNLSVRFRAKGC